MGEDLGIGCEDPPLRLHRHDGSGSLDWMRGAAMTMTERHDGSGSLEWMRGGLIKKKDAGGGGGSVEGGEGPP